MKDIIIIGGGLAGLINAMQLAKAGMTVSLYEKKIYPFHKVCGEYVSNETLPFLNSIGVSPEALQASQIRRLMVTSSKGASLEIPLEMGGFGLSRFTLDHYLYTKAKELGVTFFLNTPVVDVKFIDNNFLVILPDGSVDESRLVIGSYGKRASLDRQLKRAFFNKRSPYIGVKYHIRIDHPDDLIALHNFKDGYCGIVKIEEEKFCLCYLTTRENLRTCKDIPDMEKALLYHNSHLKKIFESAEFLYEKPEVINEISFETKEPVENHILMCGDAAGMITPLCGNGMAMAIHSAKILSELIIQNYQGNNFNREKLEEEYTRDWNKIFKKRLETGRAVQKLFGNERTTDLSIRMLKLSPPLMRWLIRQTHGEEF